MLDPNVIFPMKHVKRLCFLKNIIDSPNVIIGDYTYYDDPDNVENFKKNILYHFDFVGDQLIIGKFCQIGTGARFIMNGANHAMMGFSTFPFTAFGGAWSDVPMMPESKGNTVIGHDVWIGNSVTIMPGINIGHGAILATNAVITKDVEPYSIVGGNPAKLIRKRFDDKIIQQLLQLSWWDWPIETITRHVKLIAVGDVSVFQKLL